MRSSAANDAVPVESVETSRFDSHEADELSDEIIARVNVELALLAGTEARHRGPHSLV